jgi:hypothetical protein
LAARREGASIRNAGLSELHRRTQVSAPHALADCGIVMTRWRVGWRTPVMMTGIMTMVTVTFAHCCTSSLAQWMRYPRSATAPMTAPETPPSAKPKKMPLCVSFHKFLAALPRFSGTESRFPSMGGKLLSECFGKRFS